MRILIEDLRVSLTEHLHYPLARYPSGAEPRGVDVGKDEKEGYRLLLRAANQGLPRAQFQMGEYTAVQGNRPDDKIVAYMWYAPAERNGYKQSKKKMKELAAGMAAENIAEAQARAQKWPNLPASTSPQ